MEKIQKLSEAFNLNKIPCFFEYIKDVYNDLESLPESQSIFVDMMKKMLVGMFGTVVFPSNNFLSFVKEICNSLQKDKKDKDKKDKSDPISKNGFYPLYEDIESAKLDSNSGYIYYIEIDSKTYFMPSDKKPSTGYSTIHRDYSHTISNCHNTTHTTITDSYNTR